METMQTQILMVLKNLIVRILDMRKIKKGQISTEYLIVVAFVTFLVISALGLGLFYSVQTKDRIKFNQLQDFANKIVSSAESIYYAGEPSKATISVYLPSGIDSVEILTDQIVFNVTSLSGSDRISFLSDVPLEGGISSTEGFKRITITAQTDKVILSVG